MYGMSGQPPLSQPSRPALRSPSSNSVSDLYTRLGLPSSDRRLRTFGGVISCSQPALRSTFHPINNLNDFSQTQATNRQPPPSARSNSTGSSESISRTALPISQATLGPSMAAPIPRSVANVTGGAPSWASSQPTVSSAVNRNIGGRSQTSTSSGISLGGGRSQLFPPLPDSMDSSSQLSSAAAAISGGASSLPLQDRTHSFSSSSQTSLAPPALSFSNTTMSNSLSGTNSLFTGSSSSSQSFGSVLSSASALERRAQTRWGNLSGQTSSAPNPSSVDVAPQTEGRSFLSVPHTEMLARVDGVAESVKTVYVLLNSLKGWSEETALMLQNQTCKTHQQLAEIHSIVGEVMALLLSNRPVAGVGCREKTEASTWTGDSASFTDQAVQTDAQEVVVAEDSSLPSLVADTVPVASLSFPTPSMGLDNAALQGCLAQLLRALQSNRNAPAPTQSGSNEVPLAIHNDTLAVPPLAVQQHQLTRPALSNLPSAHTGEAEIIEDFNDDDHEDETQFSPMIVSERPRQQPEERQANEEREGEEDHLPCSPIILPPPTLSLLPSGPPTSNLAALPLVERTQSIPSVEVGPSGVCNPDSAIASHAGSTKPGKRNRQTKKATQSVQPESSRKRGRPSMVSVKVEAEEDLKWEEGSPISIRSPKPRRCNPATQIRTL